MNKVFLLLLILGFTSCYQPVLKKDEYIIVDTLNVSYNGLGQILGYSVIIKYEDRFHYGWINNNGELTQVNIKSIQSIKD